MKESYVKSIGLRSKSNLKEFSFKINTKTLQQGGIVDSTELYVKGEKVKHKFHEYLLDPDHMVSVALHNQFPDKIPFTFITFGELMQNWCPLLKTDESFVEQYFRKLDR